MNTINHNLMAAHAANNLNSHYGRLAASVQRLSTGLRVSSAADDAAGLAIRELMRADVAALHQGMRNANDAISMLQVADGALSIIDEKLIRMKELAEQAATGTYSSTQRLVIASEFTAMASEIDRIANATDFNGVKLLDGSLSGDHDGRALASAGAMKIHFGAANASAEDYYYVQISDCSLAGLGLRETFVERIPNSGPPSSLINIAGATDTGYKYNAIASGIVPMAFIPKGSKNIAITVDGIRGAEDDIQLFLRDGTHIAGTPIDPDPALNDKSWSSNNVKTPADAASFMTEANGFDPGAAYKLPANGMASPGSNVDVFNDGNIAAKDPAAWSLADLYATVITMPDGSQMNISYTGDYDWIDPEPNNGSIDMSAPQTQEKIVIDEAMEDILLIVSGKGIFNIDSSWDYMPPGHVPDQPRELVKTIHGDAVNIKTQETAQEALTRIDEAITVKDKVRAHLGALQNRLENTAANLTIQGENLQAAESRISDADIAQEMTAFVRNQILTQSATAMLGQANTQPQMLAALLNG